ncbi:uncharacterized protein LOC120216692 [Hibiscus syriacus]|uniref:uncharacterized protein LOC120216692 n=1 Tax=Hibiscus syriacus TaxID=106335 RepID=UPI00192157AD|nr:uncharacterized protein LOC120216692 [Hibiscus syriacus]
MEPQRRLNHIMKKVVMKKIIKWLDARVIYPIFDSSWVSLVQCVPKKGGVIVVKNENEEHLTTRTVTCWWICMDYKKLNKATKKDHFLFLSLIRCLIGYQARHFTISLTDILDIAISPED